MNQNILLRARTGKVCSGQIEIQTWSESERLKRALKFGGLTWATAVVCVVLPIVHFILVPGFLIAGPIVAVWVYKSKNVIVAGYGPCPYCGEKVTIGRGPVPWPPQDATIDELCSSCQNNIAVSLP